MTQDAFPWDEGVEDWCQQSQPRLWVQPDDHPPGAWTQHDPYEGWPFRTSLPYTVVHASPGVAAGTAAIGTVSRKADRSWWFLEADADRETTERTKLRDIVSRYPDAAGVADLRSGERTERNQAGTWRRQGP